jgi:hypothetical protein
MLRDFPHRNQKSRRVYNIQEATIVNDVTRSMPHIYATMDNKQADHQGLVVDIEGMIGNHLLLGNNTLWTSKLGLNLHADHDL